MPKNAIKSKLMKKKLHTSNTNEDEEKSKNMQQTKNPKTSMQENLKQLKNARTREGEMNN